MKPKPPPDIVYVVTATAPKEPGKGGKGKPPSPPDLPAGTRKKIAKASPAYEKLNQASRVALLRQEALALVSLRKSVLQVVAELAREFTSSKGTPAQKKTHALAAIKRSSTAIASAVEEKVLLARHNARDAAAGRTKASVEQVRKDLSKHGFADDKLPKLPSRTKGDHGDAAYAHAVAQSYSSAWSRTALSQTLKWEKRPELSLPAALDRTAALTDGRLRRIARTETRTAFNAEHASETKDLLTPGADWRRHAFRRWEAKLDRTCDRCFAHHGEIVPLGKPFSGGDEPANMHPHCRCIDTIVFLPPSEAG